jgi:hypothetical protein
MARISERTFVADRFSARFSFEEDLDVTLDVEVHDGHPEVGRRVDVNDWVTAQRVDPSATQAV